MKLINAYQNNLKNINLNIPENRLIVVTGLSGSGKSSLAIDVIANEGYRYFLESLPAYNQQNTQKIPTAEVDDIQGLPPVIKVEQSKGFQSINATFGTLSELTAIFRLLFARFSGEDPMSKSLFSFNHPKGACEVCRGIGEAEYIDLDKLIADENKSLRQGAIKTTLPNGYIVYSQVTVEELNKLCQAHEFSVDIPWKNLTHQQKNVVLYGSERRKVFYGKHGLESRLRWQGIKAKPREEGYYKGILPVMQDILRRDRNPNILKFASSKICPSCHGGRIKAEYLKYKWHGLNFQDWMSLSLNKLYHQLKQNEYQAGEQALVDKMFSPLLDLIRLGMGDYQLSTPSTKISSGDGQRIKLINQVNSNLQGILYVFDEPSIGLSPHNQTYLLHILDRLIKRGNTVMVVEHDLDFMRSANWIIELGPASGINGGQVVFNGPVDEFLNSKISLSPTLEALNTSTEVTNISQKTTTNNIHPQANELLVISRNTPKLEQRLTLFCQDHELKLLAVTDQPIGKTPRSNPATYTGLADKIRNLFAKLPEAKSANLGKSAFSFNNKKGRCDSCEGAGVISLSMSAMGHINQVCPTCNGKRFKSEVLKVNWNNQNISSIYNMSISDAYTFFADEKNISETLALMIQLGLGYLKLGQPSNTLSGGEAQRIKLTKHFAKKTKNTVIVLEEPSIGLHYQNVLQLLNALHQLKKQTEGIICFENHPLFKSSCDRWVNNAQEITPIKFTKETSIQRDQIIMKGVRTHSLKNLTLAFPKNQLSVVTGVSGSGKSSLVIDTLHAFGLQEMTKQFSAYQRSRVGVNFQFEVDLIEGLTPSICITSKNRNDALSSDISKQTGIDKLLRFVFSRKAQYDGEDLTASHFSNYHELGKCKQCEGIGQELLPDLNKVVLDHNKSIATGLFAHNKAIGYYGDPKGQHMAILDAVGKAYRFDLETAFKSLSPQQKEILFLGTGDKIWEANWSYKTKTRSGTQALKMPWKGLYNYLKEEYLKTRKNKHINHLTALFSYQQCQHCQGSGLKPERLTYKLANKSIHDIKSMNFKTLSQWLEKTTSLDSVDGKLLSKLELNFQKTISRAMQLHIGHLQLNRKSYTLSGGENQRVTLIKQLNSPLKGVTYILDEPTAGLSQDNILDLLNILRELIAKSNTVIVIEHHKSIIQEADYIVKMGPKAGRLGGEISFKGHFKDLLSQDHCHPFFKETDKAIKLNAGQTRINIKKLAKFSLVKEALNIPVGGITALTGKSGIGKTTLIKHILMPSIQTSQPVNCSAFKLPKTYTDVFYFEPKKLRTHHNTLLVYYLDLIKDISKIFAAESGLKSKDFSFKTKSSQCPNCSGEGVLETSLDITANSVETCKNCNGQRYKKEILSHKVNARNIAQVLNMDITELKAWLAGFKVSSRSLQSINGLEDIGLSHLIIEQKVQSLSSGEKQRLLLLNWLENNTQNNLYILDEPSIGLHYSDIDLLYSILEKLSSTNDVLVIDHNPYLLQKVGVGLVLD